VNPAFTPVVGAGPVYAAGFLGLNDGILPYANAQIYHSATWGGNRCSGLSRLIMRGQC
jgi:hypothetical protein